jgi:hypothetical protein
MAYGRRSLIEKTPLQSIGYVEGCLPENGERWNRGEALSPVFFAFHAKSGLSPHAR